VFESLTDFLLGALKTMEFPWERKLVDGSKIFPENIF